MRSWHLLEAGGQTLSSRSRSRTLHTGAPTGWRMTWKASPLDLHTRGDRVGDNTQSPQRCARVLFCLTARAKLPALTRISTKARH